MNWEEFLKSKGISEEDFAKMTPSEMAKLQNEFSTKNINDLKEVAKNAAKPEDITKAIEEFEAKQQKSMENFAPSKDLEEVKAQVENLTKSLEEANKEILVLTEKGVTLEDYTFKSAVTMALAEKSEAGKTKHEELVDFVKNNKSGQGSFEIQVKVPEIVTTGNVTPTGAADVYAAQSVGSYSEYLYGYIFLEQFLDVGNTALASIPFIDEVPGEGDAAIVAEGSLKPLIDVDFVTSYSQAEKVAGRMKATEEVLYDFGWMQSAMENTLRKKHNIARQNDVFTKTLALATPFNPSILTSVTSIVSPQTYDVIAGLAAGMANDSKGHYIPNVIFLNTLDNLEKKLSKDGNNNYITPPFASENGDVVDGIRVVANSEVTPGDFVIGDMKNVKVRNVWGYTVRFGWENDDFSHNRVTMVGESRYHVYATTNDRRGIITGTLAAVETALTS